MPRPRLYSTDAERQAAYRDRQHQRQENAQELALPRPSGVANIAAKRRWTALLERAQDDLKKALEEMQGYFDDRSEAWQESDRGQELAAKIEEIETLSTTLEDLATA